jgi:hypothetical protein
MRAVTPPLRPSTEPTERSMPPVRMTKSCPTERMAKTATCRTRLSRLVSVKKSLVVRMSAAMKMSRTRIPPLSRPRLIGVRTSSGVAGTTVAVS